MNHLNEIHTLPEITDDPYTLRNNLNINLLTDNTDQERTYRNNNKKIDNIFPSENDAYDKIIKLKDANYKLAQKIEHNKEINKEWELKIKKITNLVEKFEEDNKDLKERNNKLTEQVEYYEFKLKIVEERERVHEKSVSQMRKFQQEYENQINSLQTDYKQKEDNLRRKYQDLNHSLQDKYSIQFNELDDKINSLSKELNEISRSHDKLERDNMLLKESLLKNDKNLKMQADHYEDIIIQREKNIKDLELTIRSIKDENQLIKSKFNGTVSVLNEEINYCKEREYSLEQELIKFKQIEANKIKEESIEIINNMEIKYNKETKELRKKNDILTEKNKQIESDYTSLNNQFVDMKTENNHLKNEMKNLYDKMKMTQGEIENVLFDKDKEIEFLNEKLNECENSINKYSQTLNDLKINFEKTITDNRKVIGEKNDEIKYLSEKYEKIIKDLQSKLHNLIMKDNYFQTEMMKEYRNIDYN